MQMYSVFDVPIGSSRRAWHGSMIGVDYLWKYYDDEHFSYDTTGREHSVGSGVLVQSFVYGT